MNFVNKVDKNLTNYAYFKLLETDCKTVFSYNEAANSLNLYSFCKYKYKAFDILHAWFMLRHYAQSAI